MERTILLGIDPSFVTMGACVYDPSSKDMKLHTGDFQEVLQWLGKNCKMKQVIAIVENPALDSTTYNMWGLMKKEVLSKKMNFGSLQATFGICMNYAQKVGQNKAAAKLFITMLHKKGVPVIEIAPSKRQKAFKETTNIKGKKVKVLKDVLKLRMPTKTNAEQFQTLTGYSKRCSEHARDAATLVWGRTVKWAQMQVQILQAEQEKEPASTPRTWNTNYFIINRKTKMNYGT